MHFQKKPSSIIPRAKHAAGGIVGSAGQEEAYQGSIEEYASEASQWDEWQTDGEETSNWNDAQASWESEGEVGDSDTSWQSAEWKPTPITSTVGHVYSCESIDFLIFFVDF